MKKDVIYVDQDDEIASVTDEIVNSKEAIVALVLPKRCTLLQSSVNMKILQRVSTEAGKKVVLITSEATLMPLAGAVGVYVAKTLQSKPALPKAPEAEEPVDTISEDDEAADIDPTKPIGELAGATAVASMVSEDDKPIELGDEPDEKPKDSKSKKDKKGGKKDNKLKVPNFDKFRTRLFLIIGGVIIFIVLLYFAFVVMPKASVVVTTENKSVPVSVLITGDPSATTVDVDGKVVPAEVKNTDQSATKKFTATGEKNNGNKATGTMTITNCIDDANQHTVPAGASFSSGNYTFVTKTAVTLEASVFSGNNCRTDLGSALGFIKKVDVVATQGGDQYNLGARSYSSQYSGISGHGSDMSGGTNQIIKIVSQSDCDNTKNDLLNTNTDSYKNQLASQLEAVGLTPVKETFTATPGAVTCSPAVGQEAGESTATVQFKTSMMGVKTDGLDQIIKAEAAKQIQGSQSIIDTGLKSAIFTVKETKNNGMVAFSMQTDAQSGIKQDAASISKIIAGKKRGQSVSLIKEQPGVSDAKISYSPFWVKSTPKNVKHITVKFVNNGN